jgi:DNA repair protein RadA/Sms
MKTKTLYICTKCDAQSPKWTGRCLECGGWGTVSEALPETSSAPGPKPVSKGAVAKTVSLKDLKGKALPRSKTGIEELDRVLGGGLVPGSLTLFSGEPGIGKSTLLLQTAAGLPGALYISGEESAEQVALRFERLGLEGADLEFLAETNVATMLATAEETKPSFIIIDSIQTTWTPDVESETGSVTQIRAVTAQLMAFAKRTNIPVMTVGQVTKDGNVAGPKTLEHLVDVVISFEGDRTSNYRLLRTTKNRFGATDEVGVFEMASDGLREVANPSSFFLNQRSADAPGSVVTCIMEGTRPMLVEVQALASRTTFGYPQRKASGYDLNRLQVLLAVLTERLGVPTQTHDIHVNIAGGYRVKEPAADAAIVLAVVSALSGKVVPAGVAAFGEVGLGGELRPVTGLDRRKAEAKRLGFGVTVSPPETAHMKLAIEKLFGGHSR